MIKKLLKVKQIGRIFFLKGLWPLEPDEVVPDSKSPEYYYFVLQHSRVAVSNLQSTLTLKNSILRPWRVAVVLVILPIKLMQLKFANEIAQAFINEASLLRIKNESR